MLDGGTAVDAAIAGMFCNGVYSSQVRQHEMFIVHLYLETTVVCRAWGWAAAS